MSYQHAHSWPEGGATRVTSAPGLDANQSRDEQQWLQEANDRRATLLLPAIVLTVLLMLIGLLGNPLALYIYGWRWPPSSTKYFLVSLAAIDLMNCIITMPTEILVMRHFYLFDSDGLCKVSRFTTYVMNNATSAIFIAIAIDRYVRICHPHRRPFSAGKAQAACGVGLLLGLVVSWPALVLYGKVAVPVPLRKEPPMVNVTGAMCLVHSDMEKYTLAFFTYLCSAALICALILIVLYTLIGRTILKRKRDQRRRKAATASTLENLGGRGPASLVRNGTGRSSSSASPSLPPKVPRGADSPDDEAAPGCNVNNFSLRCKKWRPPKATLMLFLISVVFVVSFLPFLIITIIRQHRGATFYATLTPTELLVVNIFLRSYLVNNCANPIVYGLCNAQFRGECKVLVDRALRRTQPGPGSSRQNSVRSRSQCETPRRERRLVPDG